MFRALLRRFRSPHKQLLLLIKLYIIFSTALHFWEPAAELSEDAFEQNAVALRDRALQAKKNVA